MKISFRSDMKRQERRLTNLERKQHPWATVLTLNEVRDRSKDAVMTEMVRKIDRPTDFTMKALRIKNASKRRMESMLAVKDIQASYLHTIFTGGGTETDRHIVPGREAKTNAHGNLPRRASQGKGTFRRDNIVYKKLGKGKNARLRVVGLFPSSRTYRGLIDFEGICEKTAREKFKRLYFKNLRRAVAGAR